MYQVHKALEARKVLKALHHLQAHKDQLDHRAQLVPAQQDHKAQQVFKEAQAL